ncbi:MAG: anhydro-N-acetylmuramic acid kinase [Alphaproteobacteria bacterium]|nr:MAG: anhydro-N-acetylmuramic acid kinase [Alphaproteobacteria bacterium]
MTESSPLYNIIGLMSGTSMDGVDAAFIQTDGENRLVFGAGHYLAYPADFQKRLESVLGGKGDVAGVAAELTQFHIRATRELLATLGKNPGEVDYLGFHGHTIFHDPKNKKTLQIGDAEMLARETGIKVVYDFRSDDVAAGGQGAPLVPIFHRALCRDLPKPVAVLNIGGVANVTYIGANGELIAFDTGPGNAMIDDWIRQHSNQTFDENGETARRGKIDVGILAEFLADSYFTQTPPKSLDRDHFNVSLVRDLNLADGAATLAACTVQSIIAAQSFFPSAPLQWIVCGGGRKNRFLMDSLRAVLPHVKNADELGWNGDLIEAQAFAYLAARVIRGLPISFPGTTGVKQPLTGGKIFLK